jgi:hypothetical protein
MLSNGMKNFLYKFEFKSGDYENYFYQQVEAKNEKEAIVEIVSYFLNTANHKANRFIGKSLGLNWSVEKFWEKMDTRFFSDSGMEAYELITLKEIIFDLDKI